MMTVSQPRLRWCLRALWLAAFLAATGAWVGPSVVAQDSGPLEDKVKAGYLFNFAKFIEWPASAFSSPQAPLVVAVLNDAAALPVLQQVLRGKTVNGRPIEVKLVATPAAGHGAHLLLVTRAAKVEPPAIRDQLVGSSTLLVGDAENFAEKGGMIGFFKDGESLRFQLNLDATAAAGLKVSSKLSSVARVVKSQPKK